MKKSTLIKALAMMLVLVTLVGCFAACGEPQTGTPTGSGDPSATNTPTGNTPTGPSATGDPADPENPGSTNVDNDPLAKLYEPASVNYNSREFKIFADTQQAWGLVHYGYLDGLQDSHGAVVNDALHERELLMEGLYGVIVTVDTTMDAGKLATHLKTQESNQKYFADLVFINGIASMKAAQSGQLANVLTLEELNLEAPYYDQRLQQNYRVNDYLFQLGGDFETYDELVTFGILYNDKIYKEKKYDITEGSPYKMVSEYRWTYQKMLDLAQPVVANDDNQWDKYDSFGLLTENQAGHYFFLGSGIRPVETTNGNIKVTLTDGTVYAQATKVFTALEGVFTSAAVCIPARDFKEDADMSQTPLFVGDQALFRSSSLSTTLNGMPDMKSDFGILPIPMYESAQQAYYCSLNDDANRPIIIPKHVQDLHITANILEIMCYYSRYGGDESLYESFFDRLQVAKICRKPEDRQMLQLIFSSKVYDMDRMFGADFLGMHGKLSSYVGSKCTTDINSTIDTAVERSGSYVSYIKTQFTKNNK